MNEGSNNPASVIQSLRRMRDSGMLATISAPVWKLYSDLVMFYRNDEGLAWPSIDRLSNDLGMSIRQVKGAMKELYRLGLVERIKRGGPGTTNIYRIHVQVRKTAPDTAVTGKVQVNQVRKTAPDQVRETAPDGDQVRKTAPEQVRKTVKSSAENRTQVLPSNSPSSSNPDSCESPTTENEPPGDAAGDGDGGDDRAAVFDLLAAAGVTEPERSRLANRAGLTVAMARRVVEQAKARGKGPGVIVMDLRQAVEQAQRQAERERRRAAADEKRRRAAAAEEQQAERERRQAEQEKTRDLQAVARLDECERQRMLDEVIGGASRFERERWREHGHDLAELPDLRRRLARLARAGPPNGNGNGRKKLALSGV